MMITAISSATMMLLLLSRASAFTKPLHQIRHQSSQLFASTTTNISFDPSIDVREKATSTLVIGRHSTLKSLIEQQDSYVSLFGFRPHPDILSSMHESISGNQATSSHVIVPTVGPAIPRPPHRLTLCSLRNKVTRHNHPLSLHSMTDLVKSSVKGKGPVRILVCVEDEYPLGPIAGALSRAFPVFNRKTKSKKTDAEEDGDNGEEEEEERMIHVTFLDSKGRVVKNEVEINAAREASEGVRLACRLVDTHPEELTSTAFAQECHDLFDEDDTVTIEEIVGEELKEKGYGGIYNVGKGATEPPRLIIMTYDPPKDVLAEEDEEQSAITLVGKGIVYDTGGLAIKSRVGMCGMKHDMGGAAGVLGGFAAAVRLRTPRKIRLMLCLAENAIGPESVRNDDIITQYSGKTVEINNSDAEGRLVLSDAVAHATQHFDDSDLVVDMATLTGAQLVSTGKTHAAILTNKEELEHTAVKAGLVSGDLCYPLLYAPELLNKEFNSKVADMKNSVKDRSNAQCSCAGHFIESHIDSKYIERDGGWLHVDMAGPGSKAERGTGYGVGLVLSLVGAPGFSSRS
uniref:Cytosol aminopeptidase domain-containing protein n=1 Tax=Skeletonema marinoi TaxID=267567 RepID=A0A7S2LAX7_9STRA|mmetsp:Transcript_23041/g.39378  ORF Transcript_23041/g.39378 Transcript_23041/m.39378 type:complete len:572 (+) Transcript_23041:248-1963(+)